MPQIVLVAGPNGAGKSTVAPSLLTRIPRFLNADEIARELVTSGVEKPDIAAGRLLLQQWEDLEAERLDFAVETTLATRSFATRIARMQEKGYLFHLVFVWLPDVEQAVTRVQERVKLGGHGIPEEVIRRRYVSGLHHFFNLYLPMADTWRLYDNSALDAPALIARGRTYHRNRLLWNQLQARMKQNKAE
jgi:predicted ABC-type ATPase